MGPNAVTETGAPLRSSPAAETFFQRSLYLMLVTGFAALAGTGKLDLPSLLLAAPALGLRGYQLWRGHTVLIPERWSNYLTVAYFLFYLLDYFYISGNFVTATVHMVLFSMVVKIFSVQRDRDLLYLAVLSFLMVLAAAVLTIDTLFLLTFSLFLLVAFATFISMEMRRSERDALAVGPLSGQNGRFHRLLGSMALGLGASTLMCSVVIFFVLPRVNSGGYLRNLGTQSEVVSGFSQEVRLGGIGEIQQSNAVVMHVQVLRGRMPADVKWRGLAFSNFDGQRWWNNPNEFPAYHPLSSNPLYLSQLTVGGSPLFAASVASHPQTLDYKVVMEPLGLDMFFLASTPVAINGNYRAVAVSRDGSVTIAHPPLGRTGSSAGYPEEMIGIYLGESDTQDPEPVVRDSNSRDYPPWISVLYLQLPRLDERIPELARRITSEAQSNYERAQAIEDYLRQNYGYTLQLPDRREPDPLASFLFQRKRGHCEYFASSMAIMLRTLGIPARVVNGFRGGEYNKLTGSYIVREKDAHSWVEAFFPEYGWVTFDPTPAAPAAGTQSTWAQLGLYMDAAREIWREWIINYDFNHQMQLGMELNTGTNRVRFSLRHWFFKHYRALVRKTRSWQAGMASLSTRQVLAACGLALALLLIVFAPSAWRALQHRSLLRNPAKAPQTAASFWYLRMLKMIERRGVSKSSTETPAEFAASIEEASLRRDVLAFTEHYQRARFGESAEDAQKLPELYAEMSARR